MQGDDWLLLKDLYSHSSSRIKWAGQLSNHIYIGLGVRQGGVLSTSHYKRYNKPLLLHLEDAYSEVKIGSVIIPNITVADDLAVISKKRPTIQVMIWDVENNADRERYGIHLSKSSSLIYCPGRKS